MCTNRTSKKLSENVSTYQNFEEKWSNILITRTQKTEFQCAKLGHQRKWSWIWVMPIIDWSWHFCSKKDENEKLYIFVPNSEYLIQNLKSNIKKSVM